MSRNNITGNNGRFQNINAYGNAYPQETNNNAQQNRNNIQTNNNAFQNNQGNQNIYSHTGVGFQQNFYYFEPSRHSHDQINNAFQSFGQTQSNPVNNTVSSYSNSTNNVQSHNNNKDTTNRNIIHGDGNDAVGNRKRSFEEFVNDGTGNIYNTQCDQRFDFYDESNEVSQGQYKDEIHGNDEAQLEIIKNIVRSALTKTIEKNKAGTDGIPPVSADTGEFQDGIGIAESDSVVPSIDDDTTERKDRTPPDDADGARIVSGSIPAGTDAQDVDMAHDIRYGAWNDRLPMDPPTHPPTHPLAPMRTVAEIEATPPKPAGTHHAATGSGRRHPRNSSGPSEREVEIKSPFSNNEQGALKNLMRYPRIRLLNKLNNDYIGIIERIALARLFDNKIYELVIPYSKRELGRERLDEFRTQLDTAIKTTEDAVQKYLTDITSVPEFSQNVLTSAETTLSAALEKTAATKETCDLILQGMKSATAKLIDEEIRKCDDFDVDALKKKIVGIVEGTLATYQRMVQDLK